MQWKVTVKTDTETRTETIQSTSAITHMQCDIQGTMQSVTASTRLDVSKEDVLFFNGYQTWSYCKEVHSNDYQKGLQHIPQKLLNTYHFDRYGDYHFYTYPHKKGIFQGYTYMYIRHENTYHLLSSVNEEPGYTIFHYDHGILTLTRDCKGMEVHGTFNIFDLFEKEGSEEEVFDAWFKAMHVLPKTTQKLYGYSSWYNHYENISSSTIHEDLEGCKKILQHGDLFQIDDGWQPCTGDWLEYDSHKFPNGLRYETDKIHTAGFQAGLWAAPFTASVHSQLVKEHPDWLLQVEDKPWFIGSNWGGAYALDIDHPEVIAYLEKVFDQIFNEWNFDLVKLDFLYAAAPFGSSAESRSARMYRANRLLRKLCKDHPILGCGVPTCTSFGLFEYNRTGCDVSLDWNDVWYMHFFHRERVSTKHSIANTIFRRQLNTRAYGSDPDVFFLREDNIRLTSSQKEALITLDALLGNVFLTSDNPNTYTEKQIAQYRYYRHLSSATNIHCSFTGTVCTITYTLDGVTQAFHYDAKNL